MRTYGRIAAGPGLPPTIWTEVTTDANGLNDAVYLTTLIQVLKLNLGESPFFANYGIPAQQAVIQQIFPDFYIWQTQRQFASFFASLIVSKVPAQTIPTYTVNITTNNGAKIPTFSVLVPT
jgi:hypothetical protein